jgi:YggT family protein
MRTTLVILHNVVYAYLAILLIRLVIDWIRAFARDWDPSRGLRRALSLVYLATDPPIDALNRLLPRIQLGPVLLDFGFLVTFVIVLVLLRLTQPY